MFKSSQSTATFLNKQSPVKKHPWRFDDSPPMQGQLPPETVGCGLKGSMPPSIGHMELLVWMQRADFSDHIQGFKPPGDPLNSSHFDAPNTKSAPTGYRRAPNIISHHYKQQLSAKASIVPKARPIRFR